MRRKWRCFHCDAVLTHPTCAREHFGADESSEPACKLANSSMHLIRYIRKLEAEVAQYRREDSHALRAIYSKESEYADAVRKAEERGYDKGVSDMAKRDAATQGAMK